MSGIIINQDDNTFYVTRKKYLDVINEDYLRQCILQYEGTDVTDYVFNISHEASTIPCGTRTCYAEKYLRTEENGLPVDYTNNACKTAYHIWNVLGLDLYQIWIDACRSININPWFSLRMNDRHGHHLWPQPIYIYSDFFYEHMEEYSRIHGRKTEFWQDRGRDFLIKEVRQEVLAYIAEMLGRYDLYGLELDFQRQFNCFPPGHEEEGRVVMLGFVKDVKEIITKSEKQWGHKIKLSVRCHQNPLTCYELGFDILQYAKLGLIDMYIAAPNFLSSDSNMPIGFWKKMLEPYGVEVAASMEAMIKASPNCAAEYGTLDTYHSVESLMGMAGYAFTQGADKFYLYNVFDHHEDMITPEDKVEENQLYIVGRCTDAKGRYTLLSHAGSMEKIMKRRRKCVLSYTDTCALGDVIRHILPATLTREDDLPTYLKINTGAISKTNKLYLRLGTADDVSSLEVYVNDRKAEYVGCEDVGFPKGTPNPVHKYLVSSDAYSLCAQVAELIYRGEGEMVIDYADMIVEP